MRSQYNTVAQKHWTGARYNSNNAWLYNSNNGRSNNNNLYNDLYARLLDYDTGESGFSEFRDFLSEMYDSYIVTRHSKRGKATQMEFEMNLTANLVNLAAAVWNQEYIPSESICFMLEKPKLREVIAAWFGDRIVHNFKWKVACAVRKAGEYENYVFATKESFMQTVNSYLGLLKWCNANRLREEVMDTIAESGYAKVYDFNDGRKLTIKPTRTRRSYFMFLNMERKHMMLDLAKPHNNTPSPKTTQQ